MTYEQVGNKQCIHNVDLRDMNPSVYPLGIIVLIDNNNNKNNNNDKDNNNNKNFNIDSMDIEEKFAKIKKDLFSFELKNLNISLKHTGTNNEYYAYINKDIYTYLELNEFEYVYLIDTLKKYFEIRIFFVLENYIKKQVSNENTILTFDNLMNNLYIKVSFNEEMFIG